MKIIDLNVKSLKEYENNPRHNDAAVDKVAESIKEFGFKVPIIVDKNNVIITGHTRLKAAKKLGLKKVPTIVADDLTPEQIKAFRLADNKVSEYATWDEEKLYSELMELKVMDFNVESFGFETKEIDTETADIDAIKEKLEKEAAQYEDEDEPEDDMYTKKIDIPQYQITGENPSLSELVDVHKANKLIDEIEKSNAQDDVKEFLKLAAYRHLVFDYSKVAEYYAHADKEVQEMMEKSALVIIDYEDAIKYGYVQLSKTLKEIANEDKEC